MRRDRAAAAPGTAAEEPALRQARCQAPCVAYLAAALSGRQLHQEPEAQRTLLVYSKSPAR